MTIAADIITIGNSQGIRLPKLVLIESGLQGQVELKVKKGEIRILPAKKVASKSNAKTFLMNSNALRDWNRPEEDEAWKDFQ